MELFWFGIAVGFVITSIIWAVFTKADEYTIDSFKLTYGYSYDDVLKAWNSGKDGSPPMPPRPR